ncbi:MAG: hypothetical protein JNK60_21355 [Acidobacteria bacterium]|nr:hypothetical protein [Acidobacteriota bacterium]
MKRLGTAGIPIAAFLLGTFLRVVRWDRWPEGPWSDEVYAIRAARLYAREGGTSIFGSSPLVPPDAGFVNAWVSHVYLAYVALVDRLAGGGLLSIRVLSIGPSILLLLAALLLAREVSEERKASLAASALLLATSMWLLTTGRWGWDAVATSALLTLSAYTGVLSRKRGSAIAALASGALLGLAQYGYVAARLALLVPAVLLASALLRRDRAGLRRLGALVLGLVLVSAPLVIHLSTHPERALARAAEVGVLASGDAGSALLANTRDLSDMLLVRGDPNARHGDPARPVLPLLVTGLALLGLAAAVRRRDADAGEVALWAGALLLGALLARTPGGNAYRISPAAPFLLVLAGVGTGALLALLPGQAGRTASGIPPIGGIPERAKRGGAVVLGAALLVTAALEVRAFAGWARTPLTFGAFGGPERELADAISRELERAPADVILHPVAAARNPIVVEMLLSRPDDPRPAARVADLLGPVPYRFLPEADVLYAGGAAPAGAVEIARAPLRPGLPEWRLYRIPKSLARAEAQRRLEGSWFPPSGGSFRAEEGGLYTFRSKGPLYLSMGGERRGPFAGAVGLLLEKGLHDLSAESESEVHVVTPSGFEARPIPPAGRLGGSRSPRDQSELQR